MPKLFYALVESQGQIELGILKRARNRPPKAGEATGPLKQGKVIRVFEPHEEKLIRGMVELFDFEVISQLFRISQGE